MSDVFDQDTPVNEEVQISVNDLVGEGKRYASHDELAKGKVYADNHIRTLETELATLRDELKTRKTSEELINRIQSLKPPVDEGHIRQDNPEIQPDKPGLTQADVERLFAEREAKAKKENNINLAVSKLSEKYGDNVAVEINAKAKELGVTREYLRDLASQSPAVFLNLFPDRQVSRDVFNAPANGRNIPMKTVTGDTWSKFEAVRKENKRLYDSAGFQAQLFKAAEKAMNEGRYDEFMNS